MKFPTWESPKRTEVTEAPSWLDRLLDPIISQVQKITQALQRGLSFLSNVNAEIRTINVRHATEATIELQSLDGKPNMVFLGDVGIDDYAKMKWSVSDLKKVGVTVSFDSAPVDEVSVTLLILSGSP